MKENKYDNERFFAQYSQLPRSAHGLGAAGEWHELERLLPPFLGKRVLDIGCGYGWHCNYAAQQGAQLVIGTDISKKMLAAAKEKTTSPAVEYRCAAMEELDFPPGSFDIAISSLALHYTPDFELICRKVHCFLAQEGEFIFSAEHPVFTAQGPQAWVYDEQGNASHWPVDHYFSEGKRDCIFLGEPVTKYHRTITTYLGALFKTGFCITGLVEPKPAEELLHSVPGMADELRRPMMLIVRAKKSSGI